MTSATRPAQPWNTVLDGGRLRQLRRQHHLSQEQLAAKAGLSLTTIRRLERRPAASCRSRTLGRLARALGEDPADLAGRTAQPPQGQGMAPPLSQPMQGPHHRHKGYRRGHQRRMMAVRRIPEAPPPLPRTNSASPRGERTRSAPLAVPVRVVPPGKAHLWGKLGERT
jgi:transcriptional regulator with XRE-family HTH domain